MFIGVDVGTSSTKGVLVDGTGNLLAQVVKEHRVASPASGHHEMDAEIWWGEFCAIVSDLVGQAPSPVTAVGVSGMGPCVLLADEDVTPLHPAILYGVDTRATAQIAALEAELGADAVQARAGSRLSTQAVGPKVRWLAEHHPEVIDRARHLLMPASFLAYRLTGAYVLDHQSASQAVPLYASEQLTWYDPWWDEICPAVRQPELHWADEVIGTVTSTAAARTGLPSGLPVICGTIDAWTEAISADAHNVGDLMIMYGTTLFMVNTTATALQHPNLWGTVGAYAGTRNLAAGMATSGAITNWIRDLSGGSHGDLTSEAADSGPGARGLLMLPYFAGERTPIADPDARGTVLGLTTSHTRGDLYRAALEATAFGIRHNVETFREVGGTIDRVVAVGGGTQGGLWTQIVSDVTGLDQVLPTHTVGASYGAAMLAARGATGADTSGWNPTRTVIRPRSELAGLYDDRYALYRQLYPATVEINHALARTQHESGS